jgi:uncharacterized membrane protein
MDLSQLRDTFLSFLEKIPVIRAIIGILLVFFVPGYAWTLALFDKIKNVERIAISIGISIATVTLSILALNLFFHVKITGINALFTIIVITAIPLVIYLFKRLIKKRRGLEEG